MAFCVEPSSSSVRAFAIRRFHNNQTMFPIAIAPSLSRMVALSMTAAKEAEGDTSSSNSPDLPLTGNDSAKGSSSTSTTADDVVDANTKNKNQSVSNHTETDDPSVMRVSELRQELQRREIDFSDCFDKESLIVRLQEARRSGTAAATVTSATTTTTTTPRSDATQETSTPSTPPTASSSQKATTKPAPATTTQPSPVQNTVHNQTINSSSVNTVDNNNNSRESILAQVRTQSVRELREELASQKIRWADLIDKQDLVQAVVNARMDRIRFSATGLLTPGQVADVTAGQLQSEILFSGSTDMSSSSTSFPPLLLVDVYAIWCGPCQLVSKQLQAAAAIWGRTVRVVKIDSDKYPEMASRLRVQGLPTLILFNSPANPSDAPATRDSGTAAFQEIDRMEGALSKDQLIQWVQSKQQTS